MKLVTDSVHPGDPIILYAPPSVFHGENTDLNHLSLDCLVMRRGGVGLFRGAVMGSSVSPGLL